MNEYGKRRVGMFRARALVLLTVAACATTISSAAERMVLGELFTSTG